jgi:hypothetical protein
MLYKLNSFSYLNGNRGSIHSWCRSLIVTGIYNSRWRVSYQSRLPANWSKKHREKGKCYRGNSRSSMTTENTVVTMIKRYKMKDWIELTKREESSRIFIERERRRIVRRVEGNPYCSAWLRRKVSAVVRTKRNGFNNRSSRKLAVHRRNK